jgi:orotidine-5'-phosphate decarboxylase
MTNEKLISEIKRKKSFLCIGLDVDANKMPSHLLNSINPIFEFNKAIIDATHKLCIAYKPNIAFYEAYGQKGWEALKNTIDYLNNNYPEIFTIADAKRGDIGNTSKMYAKAFFEDLGFDSVTVAPYMGKDSVEPFLDFKDNHTILLALTSNEGSSDFQSLKFNNSSLYESVLKASKNWINSDKLMYVVGATKAEYLKDIRKIVPDNFLLVPGVGKQGGDLNKVCEYGLNSQIGLVVNSSREIIYASKGLDFPQKAAQKARDLQQKMEKILSKNYNF